MIKFKACPRCRGDLNLAEDIYGKYWNCLQCGFTNDVDASGQPLVPMDPGNEIRVHGDPVTHALKLQITRAERGTASKKEKPST